MFGAPLERERFDTTNDGIKLIRNSFDASLAELTGYKALN